MDLDALYVHDVAHRSGSIPLLTCNCPGCWLMSARDAHPDELPIFVVYDKPRDALESVIVRLWLTDGTTAGVWQFLDVDDANHTLEQLGLVWMPRQADDEPQIVGSWIMTIEIRDGTYQLPRRGTSLSRYQSAAKSLVGVRHWGSAWHVLRQLPAKLEGGVA